MSVMNAKGVVVLISLSVLAVILGVDALHFGTVADAIDKSEEGVPASSPDTISPEIAVANNITAVTIPSEIAVANNRFALDFYRQISSHDGNIFFSSLSMYTAFSMLYEGAVGETAGQMQGAFGFESNEDLRHNATAALMSSLNRQDQHATLTLANSLWLANWFEPYDSYVDVINGTYMADIDSVDFSESSREKTVELINGWAANKTQDKIPSVLGPKDVRNATSSVLVNAIYFKGSWETQFKPEHTTKDDFWTGTQNVTADFMHMKNRFGYAGYDEVQVLRMPYDGDRLSMAVILPSDRTGLDQLMNSVTAEQIDAWLEGMHNNVEVIIQIPKFEVRTNYELIRPLVSMGVKDVFNDTTSDLSGMAKLEPDQRLWVEKAVQSAYVKVNEEGTEAAAVTAIASSFTDSIPPPPIVFIADHPFLFLIQDDESGTILFIGRMSDPSCTIYDPMKRQCIMEYGAG